MSEQPIAWLWQNAPILEDGCYQFYPTAERANAEIAYSGGWKTPVFARPEQVRHDAVPGGRDVFHQLSDWRAEWPRLNVSLKRAEAIAAYMITERTSEYPAWHPGRRSADA